MPSKRTHRLQGLALLLLAVLAGSQGLTGAFAQQNSALIEGEPRTPRTSVHVDFRITIPELLAVSFPASLEDDTIPQIVSNVGLLTITVDDEAFTYVAMTEQERVFFIGAGDALSLALVSGLEPVSDANVGVYTVAIP